MISINNLQKKFGEKLAVNIDHYGMSSLTKLTSVKVKTGKTSQVLSLTMDF